MALPAFNEHGDMPVGVHPATIDEICGRFTGATAERQAATQNLRRICDLARSTGKLQRFIVFGSYITAKPAPNDVDVVLLMCDDFLWEACAGDVHALFDHSTGSREVRRKYLLDSSRSDLWGEPRGLHRGLAGQEGPDTARHCGGYGMIANDQELEATQERIAYFQRLLRQMRVAARPQEFSAMAGSYVAEVERMHGEVMEYLSRHASASGKSLPSAGSSSAIEPFPAPVPR